MNRNPKNSQESEKEVEGDGELVSEKTNGIDVKPGEIDDESDGMQETDYLGKSNNRNREDK